MLKAAIEVMKDYFHLPDPKEVIVYAKRLREEFENWDS